VLSGPEFLCTTKVSQISPVVGYMLSTWKDNLVEIENAANFILNYFNRRTMPVKNDNFGIT
jgi:hypothetical protein